MKVIKNWQIIATDDLREKALRIINAGICAVLPNQIIPKSIMRISDKLFTVQGKICSQAGRIFVIGGGKASGKMAEELEKSLGIDWIETGIIAEKANPKEFNCQKIVVMQAGHPVPDNRGLMITKKIFDLKEYYKLNIRDLIICLISGGGSALLTYPYDGITLEDKQAITKLLISCGADITEINIVRKHLSKIKGGNLARYFAPVPIVSLILSDVIGNDLSVIASGPTYPDSSTYQEALAVLQKYDLVEKAPPQIIFSLKQGCHGERKETPKELFNVQNFLIGDNRLALKAMEEEARYLGFRPMVVSSELAGDTEVAAQRIAREILAGKFNGYDALILGGETTPSLPPNVGKGGRNQHYAAYSMQFFSQYRGEWLLASVGSDGSDYLPGIAGALVDRESWRIINQQYNIYQEQLHFYNSYSLLNNLRNSLVITGNTYTNVGDLILYILR